jgi:hypothetical protein
MSSWLCRPTELQQLKHSFRQPAFWHTYVSRLLLVRNIFLRKSGIFFVDLAKVFKFVKTT